MTLIPASTKSAWRDAVDDLNTDLGNTCTIVFESGITQVSNVSSSVNGLRQPIIRPFGGRTAGFQIPGNELLGSDLDPGNSSSDILQVNEFTKNITARVYHMLKDFERYGISVQENAMIYRLITNKKYMPDLLRAKHVILFADLAEKKITAKLLKPPAPYGLGDLHQCRSFWQEI